MQILGDIIFVYPAVSAQCLLNQCMYCQHSRAVCRVASHVVFMLNLVRNRNKRNFFVFSSQSTDV